MDFEFTDRDWQEILETEARHPVLAASVRPRTSAEILQPSPAMIDMLSVIQRLEANIAYYQDVAVRNGAARA